MDQPTYEILDRPEVASVLFYPRRDVGAPWLAPGVFTVRIRTADGLSVGGKVFAAKPGGPVILYFHGNGEIASDFDSIAPFYTRLGLTLFIFDYRGYGASDGAPSASAMIRDAWSCFEQAPAALAEKGIEAGPMFVMGRSLGSAPALEIASRAQDQLAGLILESGFAFTFPLIERIGYLQLPDAFERRDGFGNLEKIERVAIPTLIIHGERDWIIPIGDAEALAEASGAAAKTFVRIPQAGHNDLMAVGHEAYFGSIATFCGGGVGARRA